MTFPVVRFVASPDVTAAVRFDFNTRGEWADESVWPAHAGTSLGAPTLEGDPDAVGVEYGYRALTFNLFVEGRKSAAKAVMSDLARELLRQTNWLMFQLSDLSAPVWFKTYRSAPGALDFANLTDPDDGSRDLWGIGISLDADPFAYGERIVLPSVTVDNDPAAGSNPTTYTFPTILGDAPAPLEGRIGPSDFLSGTTRLSVLSGAPSPIVLQAETCSAFADTSAPVSSTSFSGGSYRSVSFTSTPTLAQRLLGTVTVNDPGRYALYARVARSDATSTFQVRASVGSAGNATLGATIPVIGASGDITRATLVPLGLFDMPSGSSADTPTGVSRTLVSGVRWTLDAARVSGTGALQIDYLVAVPIQAPSWSVSTIKFTVTGIYGGAYLSDAIAFDGLVEAINYTTLVSGGFYLADRMPPVGAGDFPTLSPGVTNTLHLMLQEGADLNAGNWVGNNYSDQIATTTELVFAYRPLWLYLAES